ncbi:hypothetical protein STTU_0600 [Streptomyces sp. Tu6071]|nr:hypothetical protein STTU_0600 [Streptomyces sp. Tu6071]
MVLRGCEATDTGPRFQHIADAGTPAHILRRITRPRLPHHHPALPTPRHPRKGSGP